ncbi:hypothetical protein ES1_02590 [[Eubacterium] siraeum V10Sc8a]|uniref:Uncharacterized protein n=1 Tax=[Eubacterium] siraeum V10Sc8a TaxID=717961 RepID=D4MI51_9FIRM|nr:hypothetical protein ES1_02590 [[Eubacterium] siraeum V10Sc8a]
MLRWLLAVGGTDKAKRRIRIFGNTEPFTTGADLPCEAIYLNLLNVIT